MNNSARRWTMVLAPVAVLAVFGCAQKKETAAAPPPAQQATAAPVEHEAGESGATVTPAATVPLIWAQVADEQGRLSTAIQNGQLKDVHHLAFGVRDLVVALAEKSEAATPATAPRLKGMVESVKASADKLDELGDSGNLSGTQAEFAKLEATLGEMETLTVGK